MRIKTLLFLFIISHATFAQNNLIFRNGFESIAIVPFSLNDTGIVWAGESFTGNSVDCMSATINSPQDCNNGRDASNVDNTDGHAGFSFTKLDFSGDPLQDQNIDYATLPWSCVNDNVTGLVWEVKTNTVDVHNKNNSYNWGGITAIGLDHPDSQGIYNSPSWNDLVNGSNTEGLCGFDNWRVPTVEELASIVNKGTINQAIDINFFPNTQSNRYWTSSPTASVPTVARTVDFALGNDDNFPRNSNYRVRLVRSEL